MHRNTFILIIVLTVLAGLVAWNNIGKKNITAPTPTPTPNIVQETTTLYTNTFCGFSLEYPSVFEKLENATGSAILNNKEKTAESVVVTCQVDIPKPPLPADKIESLIVHDSKNATVSAKLYHDASPHDGAPIDIFLYKHPKNGMDIFVASSPSAGFRTILSTIIISL